MSETDPTIGICEPVLRKMLAQFGNLEDNTRMLCETAVQSACVRTDLSVCSEWEPK